MTNKEVILTLNTVLAEDFSTIKGSIFHFTLFDNVLQLKEHAIKLEKTRTFSKEFLEYNQKLEDLYIKHGTEEKQELSFLTEKTKLDTEYADVLVKEEPIIKDYNMLLERESGIVINKLKLAELPTDLIQSQVKAIRFMTEK